MNKSEQQNHDRVLDLIEAHTHQDDIRFSEVIDGQTEIKGDIKSIKENHLTHIQTDMATQTADVAWLKQFFWVVITASVGALVVGLINLLHK